MLRAPLQIAPGCTKEQLHLYGNRETKGDDINSTHRGVSIRSQLKKKRSFILLQNATKFEFLKKKISSLFILATCTLYHRIMHRRRSVACRGVNRAFRCVACRATSGEEDTESVILASVYMCVVNDRLEYNYEKNCSFVGGSV